MKPAWIAFTLLVACLTPGAPVLSEGGIGKEVKAQIWAEQGLKYNNYYLKAINPAISNYGTPEQKRVFQRCVNHYLQSQVYFLSQKFNRSYKEVRLTQRILIQLYMELVRDSHHEVRVRLYRYANKVIYGSNGRARKYLTLGLRDLENAKQKVIMQHHFRPWLYLLKLNELVEAMKLIRHANRFYVLLALEFDSLYPADTVGLSYKKARRLISSGFPGNRTEMLRFHDDNYFKVYAGAVDLWLKYKNEPDFQSLRKDLPGWLLKDPKRYDR